MSETDAILAAHVAYMRAGGLSAGNRDTRAWVVRRCLRHLGADAHTVTAAQLVSWLGAQEHLAPATRASYRGHLRGFFGWLVEFEFRADNPAARLPRVRIPHAEPKPATPAQLADVLAKLPARLALAVTLAALAGLRCVEIARLTREDVTEETILVRGKGGHVARVPTHPRVWALVRDAPPGPLVRTYGGRPVSAHWVSDMVRRTAHRLGVPVSAHMFRHYFGTHVQRSQGDLRVTQELMRHASPATTARYTQVTTAAKVAAVATLRWSAAAA